MARMRAARALPLLCLLVLHAISWTARADVTKEYELKAAFIFNFVRFVDWPDQKFADANSPIIAGLFGGSPLGAELETVVRGRKINGRPIVIKAVQTIEAARLVDVLFISAAEDSQASQLIAACKSAGVLTVGESDTFEKGGGMITFLLKDDKLRFDINMATAESSGLDISAQLQKLANTILRK